MVNIQPQEPPFTLAPLLSPPPSSQVTLPSSPQRGASCPPHEGHFPPLWPVSLVPFLAPGSCHGFSPEGRSQVPSQGHGCHLWAGQDLPDTTHSFGAGSPKPREGRPCVPAALRTNCSPKLFAQTVRPSMVASPEHMQVDLSERLPSWLHSAALSCKRQKAHPWKEIPLPFSTKFQVLQRRGAPIAFPWRTFKMQENVFLLCLMFKICLNISPELLHTHKNETNEVRLTYAMTNFPPKQLKFGKVIKTLFGYFKTCDAIIRL